MRSIFLFLAFTLCCFFSFAQKNSILIDGNISIAKFTDKEYETTDRIRLLNLNKTSMLRSKLISGYQFNKNWTVGLLFSYNKNKFVNFDYSNSPTIVESPVVTINKGLGAFTRYSKKLNDIFFIIGQLEVETLKQIYKVERSNIETVQKPFRLEFIPKIGINIYKNFALNLDFGGFLYTTKNVGTYGNLEFSGFELNFGRILNIGVSKNFALKNK
jgi:hypothetical protein